MTAMTRTRPMEDALAFLDNRHVERRAVVRDPIHTLSALDRARARPALRRFNLLLAVLLAGLLLGRALPPGGGIPAASTPPATLAHDMPRR
jgi:hypothetical protein